MPNPANTSSPTLRLKMFCEGEGKQTFLETLKRLVQYKVTESGELQLMQGEMVLIKLNKK